MTFDKITVVINTFQSEDKINQCLDSIDRNCKVIIVENSANDSFKKKIEEIQNQVNMEFKVREKNYPITVINFLLNKH